MFSKYNLPLKNFREKFFYLNTSVMKKNENVDYPESVQNYDENVVHKKKKTKIKNKKKLH